MTSEEEEFAILPFCGDAGSMITNDINNLESRFYENNASGYNIPCNPERHSHNDETYWKNFFDFSEIKGAATHFPCPSLDFRTSAPGLSLASSWCTPYMDLSTSSISPSSTSMSSTWSSLTSSRSTSSISPSSRSTTSISPSPTSTSSASTTSLSTSSGSFPTTLTSVLTRNSLAARFRITRQQSQVLLNAFSHQPSPTKEEYSYLAYALRLRDYSLAQIWEYHTKNGRNSALIAASRRVGFQRCLPIANWKRKVIERGLQLKHNPTKSEVEFLTAGLRISTEEFRIEAPTLAPLQAITLPSIQALIALSDSASPPWDPWNKIEKAPISGARISQSVDKQPEKRTLTWTNTSELGRQYEFRFGLL